MIKILKDKSKRRRIQRKVPKLIWDFGLVLEAEIYSCTAGNYGQTPMQIFTGDIIKISQRTEFEFYNFMMELGKSYW